MFQQRRRRCPLWVDAMLVVGCIVHVKLIESLLEQVISMALQIHEELMRIMNSSTSKAGVRVICQRFHSRRAGEAQMSSSAME